MKFAFIQAQASTHAVTTLCRVLAVSKAGYYAWCRRVPSPRAQTTAALTTVIDVVFHATYRRYGSPRVQRELRAQGRHHSRKRIAAIMRRHGWRARTPRRYRAAPAARGVEPLVPNVLNRRFAPALHPRRDRAWVADFTYVATREGWRYLAVLIDLTSRRVVGWAMRDTMSGDLTLAAFTMALAQRRPPPGLLHHSDRGSQYVATDYQALLAAHRVQQSLSRKGNCWDNAVVESFFATLKRELMDDLPFATQSTAQHIIAEYIETWYNRQRRHSSLNYRSPHEHERFIGKTI